MLEVEGGEEVFGRMAIYPTPEFSQGTG